MGIFSQGGNISLTSGSLVVGTNNAVGVFASGANQTITSTKLYDNRRILLMDL